MMDGVSVLRARHSDSHLNQKRNKTTNASAGRMPSCVAGRSSPDDSDSSSVDTPTVHVGDAAGGMTVPDGADSRREGSVHSSVDARLG